MALIKDIFGYGAAMETSMPKVFEPLLLDREHVAEIQGFAIIRLAASPSNRTVVAQALLNGEIIASGSAADNFAPNVISSPTQTFTVPVPKGAKLKVVALAGSSGVEVFWLAA